MGFSFNEAEEQRDFVNGPVPAGSRVLVKIEIQAPKDEYAAKPGSLVSKAASGMFQLNCKFTVMAGTYSGYHWYENMALPVGMQKIELTYGQTQACNISYSKMRAILEVARNIDPADRSPRANAARSINSWDEFQNMQFPARLGIKKSPRLVTDKNGIEHEYWDNQLGMVLTSKHPDFQTVKNGGEIITDGPTKGESPYQKQEAISSSNSGGFDYDGAYDRSAKMKQDALEDMPF